MYGTPSFQRIKACLKGLIKTTQSILLTRTQTSQTNSGDDGRGPKESKDTNKIDATITSNVRDICGKESTLTTRAGRKIKKLAHLKDYFHLQLLLLWVFLLCQEGMVFILTEVNYLHIVLTLLWLLSMFSYIVSVAYYSQELSMTDFVG